MKLLYDTYQQSIKNKLDNNELLTLDELSIIIKDINNFKLSQSPGIEVDTKTFCLDRNLMNEYLSKKYSDSIYYVNNKNNIYRFFI